MHKILTAYDFLLLVIDIVTLHFLFSAMKDVAHYIAAFLLFTVD